MNSHYNFMKRGFAAVMALSLMACSNGSSSSTSSSSSASSSTSDAIKIGGSGPLTGGAATYGNAVKNAAELAVAEINAKGGQQFELKFEDDEHDAEKAVNAYGVLKDWGMQASLGTVTSTPMTAVAPMYNEDHIFAITPSASSLDVIFADSANESGAYGNTFQMCFTDPNQGVAAAQDIAAHPNYGSAIAVIYKNDDTYSQGVRDKFIATAKTSRMNIVYEGTFDSNNAQDFSVQLGKAQSAGADLIFIPIYYEPASLIMTQANQMGYAPTFYGVDGLDGILSLENFDTSLAEGAYLLTPFSADASDEKTQNFVKNYQEKYGETPNQFAADAYDCVYAIAQACEAAGVTSSSSAQEVCDALISQFTSMTFDGLTGTATWNESGEVSKSPKAVVIQNGTYVGVE